MMTAAYVAMLVSGLGMFTAITPDAWKLPLAILFSSAGGMLPDAVLAGAAVHAPSPAQVGSVSGVIVQGANSGSLLGPPLLAAVAVSVGWHGGSVLLAACSGLGLLLTLMLAGTERRLIAGQAGAGRPGSG